MDLQSLIPQNKFDIDAVERAAQAGHPTIAPILDELLEWMSDANWPVAMPLRELLVQVGAPLAPHVLKVLQGPDDLWKYWVLTGIAIRFDSAARAIIIDECRRIMHHPTMGEVAEEVTHAARDIVLLHERGDD